MQSEAGAATLLLIPPRTKSPRNLYLISVTARRALDLEKADECASLKTTQLADTVIAARRIHERARAQWHKGVIKFSPSRIYWIAAACRNICVTSLA
jgi:hypothetical protein